MDTGMGVRVVPGGSSIRDGAYVGKGVICVPPMYINIGAYVDESSLVDSHALVGSCAQVGKRVHISAGAQIGGVIEPVGAIPVIIEDEVLVGGNTGIYEGAVIKTARGHRRRHDSHRLDAYLRSPQRSRHQARRGRAAGCARRRGRRARRASGHARDGTAVGPQRCPRRSS